MRTKAKTPWMKNTTNRMRAVRLRAALLPSPEFMVSISVPITLGNTSPAAVETSTPNNPENVYRYGYFETRMQVPRGSGLVTGFFTYARPGGENSWDEIDIEILGRDTRAIQFTYFRQGDRHIETRPLGFDAAEGPHTYAFEWTPRAIRWYVDGRMVHEETGSNGPLPQGTQRLYLHMWNTETLNDWLGPILPWEGPWRLNVSCIAYAPTYAGRSLCAGPSGSAPQGSSHDAARLCTRVTPLHDHRRHPHRRS